MALIDDIKVSLRVVSPKFDDEVEMLIGAALYDMERVGINPALLELDENGDLTSGNKFVKHAVTAYVKANFGYDNAEAQRFDGAYRRIVCDLLNSAENIAAMAEEEVDPDAASQDEQLVVEPADGTDVGGE